MNNSELSRYCHANDERRDASDGLKVEGEFQRGGEKFQRKKGVARCPPCSQTAHDQNVLGQCAQSRATLATPLNGGKGNWKTLVERA